MIYLYHSYIFYTIRIPYQKELLRKHKYEL